MNINLGSFIIPSIIFLIICIGFFSKIQIFDVFLNGAKEGFAATIKIAPSLIGLITAVHMLNSSGAIDIFSSFVKPMVMKIAFPPEVVPLAILRPISGSGTMAFLDNILSVYGPDSEIGKIGSIISGATETTFYTIAVYFGAVGIKKSRHTVPSALLSDLTTIALSFILVRFFGF